MYTGFSEETRQLLSAIQKNLGTENQLFLVGGAVRDALLQREVQDIDISSSGDVFSNAKRIANLLDGAYYPMDEEHGTARVVLEKPNGRKFFIDFNKIRGENIFDDIKDRDFTINAIAIELGTDGDLVDPLNGARDLMEKRLVLCSPEAVMNDPVRAIRGIRFAVEFGLTISPEIRLRLREGANFLFKVSIERIRDELFKLLDGKDPVASIQVMERLEILNAVLPELTSLKHVSQSLPHISDVWQHSINTTRHLNELIQYLSSDFDPELNTNFIYGYLSLRLGSFRDQMRFHLQDPFTKGRSRKALLLLAALYHDAGKPATRSVDDEEKIRFFEHESLSSCLVKNRARALHLSNDEIEAISMIVENHMRPVLLALQPDLPSSRSIFRFFRKTGSLGIDISLLSLADTLATYGPTLPSEKWIKFVDTIRELMEAYWLNPEKSITPQSLLNGRELIDILNLEQGPVIGQLLDSIRLAQVEGLVNNREEAIIYARNLLKDQQISKP